MVTIFGYNSHLLSCSPCWLVPVSYELVPVRAYYNQWLSKFYEIVTFVIAKTYILGILLYFFKIFKFMIHNIIIGGLRIAWAVLYKKNIYNTKFTGSKLSVSFFKHLAILRTRERLSFTDIKTDKINQTYLWCLSSYVASTMPQCYIAASQSLNQCSDFIFKVKVCYLNSILMNGIFYKSILKL